MDNYLERLVTRPSGYGVHFYDGKTVKLRYKRRHQLSAQRLRVSSCTTCLVKHFNEQVANCCLIVAFIGILLAVIETEVTIGVRDEIQNVNASHYGY